MKKIALLGATGYIGKSLVYQFSKEAGYEVFLFVRSVEKIQSFLKDINAESRFKICTYSEFDTFEYDLVINCTGVGNPSVLKSNPSEVFRVTEDMDSRIIEYIKNRTSTLYLNISSGSVSSVPKSNISQKDFYSLAKKISEDKHRALPELNIVDVRIFSFFSRFYDKDSGFLMSDIADCLINKKVFTTTAGDIIRDYITTEDLFASIVLIIKKEKINDYFDLYSSAPVSKLSVIDVLNKKYNLQYKIVDQVEVVNSRVVSNEYFSVDTKASMLGYTPKYSSIEGIEHEIKAVL